MQVSLPTAAGQLVLEISEDRLVASCASGSVGSQSAAESVRGALASPLGYPLLSESILPGDRVTIGVDSELPQVPAVVNELLSDLIAAGCEPGELTVLVGRREQQDELQASWPPAWQREVRLVLHDASDDTTHAYLAATRDGRAIYLNRAISDADVFLPVGVQRLESTLDQRGIHGSWFPAFSNQEAQLRHQAPGNAQWQVHRRRRRQETEEAAWLLGARQVVQVLPGPAGQIAGSWYGDADEVAKTAGAACRQLWQQEIERPAELVVAVLDGPASEQSWGQVARVLAMAAEAVVDHGTIVLWTELSADPGPALKSLADLEATQEEQRLALLKQRSADATAAMVIGDLLQRYRVFLRSELEDATVEDLGLGSLHNVPELQRLIDHAASCLVICSAQHAGVQLKHAVEVP